MNCAHIPPLIVGADGTVVRLLESNLPVGLISQAAYQSATFRLHCGDRMQIFFPNRWERRGHFDKPPMTLQEIFGLMTVPGALRMATKPNVVIIA